MSYLQNKKGDIYIFNCSKCGGNAFLLLPEVIEIGTGIIVKIGVLFFEA